MVRRRRWRLLLLCVVVLAVFLTWLFFTNRGRETQFIAGGAMVNLG